MHILKSNVYEVVVAACKEAYFNDEFTGCSKAEIVAYFRLLDHRQESILDIDVVIEHIEHFQHRVSRYSFLLDFIRYHVKSMALDNAINANKAKQQKTQREHQAPQHHQAERAPEHGSQQVHRQPAPQPNYVERPVVAPTRQATQPQHANATQSASIGHASNTESYDEAMFEQPVVNVDQSEQPIYGDMSHAEDYGLESDAHHVDMGYREDDDLY